jgi:prolycopene isomerase
VPEGFDAVVLGSGIGGLTCGAFLAQAGMRVAVLEKHIRTGGYAHSFKRKAYTFESGIHSVPMAPDGLIYHLLRKLGVDNQVNTIEQREMFAVQSPGFSFAMPSRKEDIRAAFLDRFPQEKQNIGAFFAFIDELYDHLARPIFEDSYVEEDTAFAARFHRQSYQSLIYRYIDNPDLRFALCSQWPYAGISPDRAAALFTIMMFAIHYYEGSHYCEGGFCALADALGGVITDAGGVIRTRAEATRLRTEHGRVVAAITTGGDEYRAPLFISNISPYRLHFDLLPEESRSKRWMRRLGNLSPSISSLSVYLGMTPDVGRLIDRAITFWFASRDHEAIYEAIDANDRREIDHLVFLRSTDAEKHPTLTLMNFVKKSYSGNWREDKHRMADAMLQRAEQLYPGISACITLSETGSPATFERYTGNTDGALYGFENTSDIYGEAKMPIQTHVANLFQTGHWGKPGGGVWNVMVNGYTAAKMILRAR